MKDEPTVTHSFRGSEESLHARIARVSRAVTERSSERDQFGGLREIGTAHGPRVLELLNSSPTR